MNASGKLDVSRGDPSAPRSGFARGSLLAGLIFALVWFAVAGPSGEEAVEVPAGRKEVVFWHFWGGENRKVVDDIVARFNASQEEHFVRAIAMPGQNLDLKFFLSVAGGDPPDLLNQDDPVIGDWASRGAILALDSIADDATLADGSEGLREWLFPAAARLGTYDGKLYGLCNGLDIRALYYNQDTLQHHGFDGPPRTIAELDEMARSIAPPAGDSGGSSGSRGSSGPRSSVGYLPDPRRIWAWGIVFGGRFYDESTGEVLVDSPAIVRALEWMAGYARDYGAAEVSAFRKGDQALAGAAFPLLQGRYAMLMDGQWRVKEMHRAAEEARTRGEQPMNWGVAPLPPPPGGLPNAGWVNGNFFLVPRGANNPQGAWEFMKFWSGYNGHEAEAARIATAGGWIPASRQVVDQPAFQSFLSEFPEFRAFVDLAESPNQVPRPVIPGASFFDAELIRAAEDALYRPGAPSPHELLETAAERIRARLEELESK